uniref:CRAL-TRIO domain-containing protein n=1 Tax=Heterorhabditis bacteriophora TaxID=37862 RepID=A0A1I7X1S7_HETBA
MTIQSSCRSADPPSKAEKEAVNELRNRVKQTLRSIPEDLDTDLNLLRWIRGYQGKIDKICIILILYTFIKTFKTSDYLIHCFGYSELLLQLILKFPEMVQRIFLVNPPRLISVLWKIARLFLTEDNLKRIEILTDSKDMPKHLPKWFVPKEFGGDFINAKCAGDESGVSIRKKISSADHYQLLCHYKSKGVERPKSNRKDISPGEKFTVPIIVPEGRCILWDFTVSGEIDFHIYKDKDELCMVYPKLRLVTNKLSEEGILENLVEGEYSLRFHNRSAYFTVKLEYSITVA